MKKTKLSDDDIKKIIATLKAGLGMSEQHSHRDDLNTLQSTAFAFGFLKGSVDTAIKQLEGDYPIF